MDVRVRFYGNYRRLVDSPQIMLTLDRGATPIDVVRTLADRYGENLRTALMSEHAGVARLRPGIRIAVGDEVIDCGAELNRPLRSVAAGSHSQIEVFIFPSLSGGSP